MASRFSTKDDQELDALVARRIRQAKALSERQGRRRIILWHRTSAAAATRILRSGFRDGSGFYMTVDEHRGVWLSNVPLSIGEGTSLGALLRVDLAMGVTRLLKYEWPEVEKPYREFLIPSVLLNARARVTVVDADDEPARTRHTRIVLERAKRRRSIS